jgi:hypothetical protein
MKTKLLITGLAFFAITSTGISQNSRLQSQNGTNQCNCTQFVDENKNGMCDNHEKGKMGPGKRNGNGCGKDQGHGQNRQGIMNGQGGRCKYYTDENKNGICDRKEDMRESKPLK